ncbi:type IV secretion system protein [Amaricoccus solimangrovi]|uniref:Type IV secretion system protein n=1 Tax=Amaricoccus solimangrovi TaxID=2589815 RepID=A0A501WBK5_9RHOB|nr:type IV secretion system protein [Amaricoccus solimangrovi]TPE47313.1 type IV secretion system protein [Amaricoccus solimangrovi]
MATFIVDTLAMVDATVAAYAETVFVDFGGAVTTTIRLAGIVALAFLGANVVFQWAPIRATDFAKWGMRYVMVLAIATSWAQFAPIYDILTNVPGSIGARLLDASGDVTLNEALDEMVTSIFDFSDRAADESGYFSISLLSVLLAVVGALMACVAIVVAGIGKIGLAMAISLAPVFIGTLLFKATSDLFSSWAKFTLGFAMIPLVLAGVMGAIVRIGEDLLLSVDTASTLTEAAGFLIVAMAAIFLMSQVPSMVNGLAGTVVATASGVREASMMAAGAVATGGLGAAAYRAGKPMVAATAGAARAGAAAPAGQRGTAFGQELIASYQAAQIGKQRYQQRLASLGKRSTMGGEFEAGQAAMMQYVRDSRARAARVAAAMPPTPSPTGTGTSSGAGAGSSTPPTSKP